MMSASVPKKSSGSARKKWFVVNWTRRQRSYPSLDIRRSGDVSEADAISRIKASIEDEDSAYIPADGLIMVVPHERGMRATEAGRYDSTIDWRLDNAIETITPDVALTGTIDIRRGDLDGVVAMQESRPFWIGYLDIETHISKYGYGILVFPDTMIEGFDLKTQDDLFQALALKIDHPVVLRAGRLMPARLASMTPDSFLHMPTELRNAESEEARILYDSDAGFSRRRLSAEEVAHNIFTKDESRAPIILKRS